MQVLIDNKKMQVFVTKKITNKNTYIRVKDDLNIYVTTNYLTTNNQIIKLINDNQEVILKMYLNMLKRKNFDNDFYYLGKKYNIVYVNNNSLVLTDDKVLVDREYDINKWLLKQSKIIFKKHLDNIYKNFPVNIPYPSLTIRNMKTRFGVCNIKTKRVTLNLELIKRDLKYLDYVIVHELSHLVYPNHSKKFWDLVELALPNYKILRKELKKYE